jgi:hypothetical protein
VNQEEVSKLAGKDVLPYIDPALETFD